MADYTPTKQRTLIVTAFAQRISDLYWTGATEPAPVDAWLRKVGRGPLRPISDMFPSCIVRDAGQARKAGREAEEMTDRRLSIDVVLVLAEAWETVDVEEQLTDRVEALIYEMEQYCPPYGVSRMDYVNDDKPDVLFMGGQSNALWVVSFECEYFAARQVRDNRTVVAAEEE
jgi:hypothetical protein